MPEWVWLIAVVIGYVILTQWLLPKLGFPLEGALVAPSLGARMRTRPPGGPRSTQRLTRWCSGQCGDPWEPVPVDYRPPSLVTIIPITCKFLS